jgi:hypothetical protein
MRTIGVVLAFVAFSTIPNLRAQDSAQTVKSKQPIVATVHRDQGKLKITVEPNGAPDGDLLRAFGILKPPQNHSFLELSRRAETW